MIQYESEVFDQLFKEFPSSKERGYAPKPTLKYKISEMSVKGIITIRFNAEVYQFEELNDRMIQVIEKKSKKSNSRMLSSETTDKPWIDLYVKAGEFSDGQKLGFKSDAKFIDGSTLEIQLQFDNQLDVSLFSESDKIKVDLWGPFVSTVDHEFCSDETRSQLKDIPPQIKEDLATETIQVLTEEKVIASSSSAAVSSNIIQKIFTNGTLNCLIGMITGMQLIMH